MQILLRKLFYPSFLLIFLLSLFLMESEYKFYLFALWSIFLLFYSFTLRDQKAQLLKSNLSKNLQVVFIFSFLFLVFSLATNLFSHHIPLSLEKYFFYLISISVFLFFLRIQRKFLKIELFIDYLLLLVFALNNLVIFLNFLNNALDLLPGMNLLVRHYGHNHYAAFLLLVLPLIWWRLLKKPPSCFFNKKLRIFFDVFLLLSSYVLLMISLGRLALFIGIIQFFFIFLSNKKDFHYLYKKKTLYFFIKTSILSFLSLALIFIFLSLPLSSNDKNSCSLSFYRKDLCISLTENSRFFYWRQARLVFKNYPIFGHGLGSFKYAARRFPIINEQHSAYTHNIFLHNLAEMGILGGVSFLILILLIFYQAGRLASKSKKTLNKFLYLAAVSSLINALFDFDWNFFVIFLLTILFLAFILSEAPVIENNKKTNKLWLIYLSIVTFLTTLLLFADFLTVSWQAKKPENWLKFTPFLNFAAKAPIEKSVMNANNYEILYDLYRYDPDFISQFLNMKGLDQKRKNQLYLDLAEIDPVAFINIVSFQELSSIDAELLLHKYLEVASNYQMLQNHYFISYQEKMDLAAQVYKLGQNAYSEGDWSRASYFYNVAYSFNPYVFFDKRALFLDESDFEKLLLFLLEFKDFSPHKTGDFNRYIFLYQHITTQLFEENRLEEFQELMFAMLDQEPEGKWYLIDHLQKIVRNEDQKLIIDYIEENYQSN